MRAIGTILAVLLALQASSPAFGRDASQVALGIGGLGIMAVGGYLAGATTFDDYLTSKFDRDYDNCRHLNHQSRTDCDRSFNLERQTDLYRIGAGLAMVGLGTALASWGLDYGVSSSSGASSHEDQPDTRIGLCLVGPAVTATISHDL